MKDQMTKRNVPPPTRSVDEVDPSTLLQRATEAQEHGQWEVAMSIYEQILAVDRRHVRALCGQAEGCLHTGQRARGLTLAEAAVDAVPHEPACQVTLSKLQQGAGLIEVALQSAERARALQPTDPAAYVEIARCLQRSHQLDEALTAIDRAIELAPEDPFPLSLKANLLMAGKDDRSALSILEKVLSSPQMKPGVARSTLHTLGMVRDRLGDYPAAFQAFAQCGQLTAQTALAKRCNPSSQLHMIEILRSGYTAARLGRFAATACDSLSLPAPAFLVGFPRSGTTLTEQILAAHPDIVTSDEKPFLNAVRSQWAKLVGGSDDVGTMIERTTSQQVQQLRQIYWDKVDAVIEGQSTAKSCFLDKLPLNIVNLGLINLVFPDAKVIVALRDPRDVCLSCFMQDFRLNNSMIHFLTLPAAIHFYSAVMDLYLHFRDVLNLEILEVRYEDTVADLETEVGRMLAFLDLAWDDDIRRFHEGVEGRFISTPSAAAVREPIHTRALQRWKNYAEYFKGGPLPLTRFVKEFGYESVLN